MRGLRRLAQCGASVLFAICAPIDAQTQFVPTPVGSGYRVFPDSRSLALADLNGDGALDVALASHAPTGVCGVLVFVNDGRGGLTPRRLSNLPSPPVALAAGDIDGDGDVDLVVEYSFSPYRLTALLNDGRGNFTQNSSGFGFDVNGWLPDLFDVDRDGDLDLLVTSVYPTSNQLFINRGNGVFVNESSSRLPAGFRGQPARPIDIDRDGWTDLVAGRIGMLDVLRNDGTGRFLVVQSVAVPNPYPLSGPVPVVGDIDNDGDADVLGVQVVQSVMLVNDGTGRLALDTQRLPALLSLGLSAAFGDIDDDGDLDIVIPIGWFQSYVYLNDGRGYFADATASRLGIIGGGDDEVVLGDLDGDRDLDLVFAPFGDGPLPVYTNRLRHVDAVPTVRIGTGWPIAVWARTGFASAPQVAVPFADTHLIPSPIRLPFGTVFLANPIVFPALALGPPSGVGVALLAVPNAAHLVGQMAHVQALVVHDGARFGLTSLASARILP